MPDSSTCSWDAGLYDRAHSFVYTAAADLVEVLDPREGERILDIGCGTGQLTGKIATGGAEVLGIDSSPEMVAAARQAFPRLAFEVADVRSYRTAEPFDAVFSNATLHWVRPPADAAASVVSALKPGGRFIAEFGGKGNIQILRGAMESAFRTLGIDPTGISPWYFPSIGEYAALLESHGMDVQQAITFPRFTPLDGPAGLRNWITMFGGAYMHPLPADRHEQFFELVESVARPTLFRDQLWHADYHRLRVVAVKQ
jgi:trans-aconitate 2-methyltransferase